MAITTGLLRSAPPVQTDQGVPWTALALVLSGLLGGLLTLGIGRSLGPEVAVRVLPVVECSGFASEGQPSSFGAIRLSTPASSGAVLDLYFMDAGRTILRTQHAELIAGAQMSFGMPTREMGSTIRVVGSEAVEVQVAVGSTASGGVAERRPLACTRLP